MQEDPYKILQVSPDAEQHVIAAAYRSLAKKYHPDKSQARETSDRMVLINWAYSILSNPTKRAEYDKARNQASAEFVSNLYRQTKSQTPPSRNHTSEKPLNICQRCFQIKQTKYVEFYKNIGLLVLRREERVKGNLCKLCIGEVFWSFTLTTLILGWWGVISFIVTPIYLINNTARYIGSLGMGREKTKSSKNQFVENNDSPNRVLVFIVFIIIFAIVIGVTLAGEQNARKSTYSSSVATRTPKPTYQFDHTNTPKLSTYATRTPVPQNSSQINCIRWDRVSDIYKGQQICVYGEIVKSYSTDVYSQLIRFSDHAGTFLLRGEYYYFEGIVRGDCVATIGVVQRDGGYLYMDIGYADLYKYDDCR
jgi:hypothetical protein